MATIHDVRAAMVVRWVGLPGQYDVNARIELGSLTATGHVNARILIEGEQPHPVSIAAADLAACLEAGWFVPESEA